MVDAVTSHVVALSREPLKQGGIIDLRRSSRSGFGSGRLPSLSSAIPRQVDVALDQQGQQGGALAGGDLRDSDSPAPASTASVLSSYSNGSASFLSSPANTATGVSSRGVLGGGAVASGRVSASASPTMPAQSPGMASMSERKRGSFFERKGSGASSQGETGALERKEAGALERKESSKDLLVNATRKMSSLGLLSKVFVHRTTKKRFCFLFAVSLYAVVVACVCVCVLCVRGGETGELATEERD